ncbi:hypothetical protein BJV78DRAFT_289904 [Lactifluus subvellereus]|nr:hypothetical protein BJV78DRAFT_289904 [Lactifluus subvellereus]
MHIPVGIRSFSRRLARSVQQRANSSTNSTSTPAPSSGPPQIQLSTSAKSLIGFCTVLGTILFAIVAWKLRSRYRRRKIRLGHTRFSIIDTTSEKQRLVFPTDSKGVYEPRNKVLPPAPSSPTVGWVPQIRSVTLPSGVTVPPVAVTAYSRSPKLQDEYPQTPLSAPSTSPLPTPPPIYRALGIHTIPVPPTPEPVPHDIPPPTPMSKSSRATDSTPICESFDLPPAPSPRSSSFIRTTSTLTSSPRPSLATVFAPKSFPRLMLVTTSFEPTRDDELAVRTGETLRLIREFEDEWCLVQRVGRPEAERGVIPRSCLTDRPRIIKNRVTLSGLTVNVAGRK